MMAAITGAVDGIVDAAQAITRAILGAFEKFVPVWKLAYGFVSIYAAG